MTPDRDTSTVVQAEHRVAIVVDPSYAERIVGLARECHVWVVRSALNDPVVAALREENSGFSFDSSVTTGAKPLRRLSSRSSVPSRSTTANTATILRCQSSKSLAWSHRHRLGMSCIRTGSATSGLPKMASWPAARRHSAQRHSGEAAPGCASVQECPLSGWWSEPLFFVYL
jgi:hypothetical protein